MSAPSVTHSRPSFAQLIDDNWRQLFDYAFRMTLSRDSAAEAVQEAFLRAYVGQESIPESGRARVWLLRIVHHVLDQHISRNPEVSFDVLDETLRSEATRTDVVRSLTDPQRDFLLWELKQGCMTAVVNCLAPGERAAFVAANILSLDDAEAAAVLGVSTSAFKVRLSRARKKVADYLAPRCEHVDPMNPCRCPARVGTAVRKGFIRPLGEVNLRGKVIPFGRYGSGPSSDDAPLRDIAAIYKSLPEPDPPPTLHEELLAKLSSGEWDTVREAAVAERAANAR